MERSWRQHLDLITVGVLSSAFLLLVAVFPDAPSPLRIVLGFVFVLLAPGYALTAALFVGADDIDDVERLVLSVGLSIVAVPLLGLALNYSPWGIRLVPLTLGLWLITITALLAALHQRRRVMPVRDSARPSVARQGVAIARLVILVGFVMAGVVWTVQEMRPPAHATEFYLLGPEGGLEGYPLALAPGEPFTVTVGITSHETAPISYRIAVPFADMTVEVPELVGGASWEAELELTAPHGIGTTVLAFELYRIDDAEPYRFVHFSVMLRSSAVPSLDHLRRESA